MNSWANIGELVFILSKDNEPIPCKVIKEIGTGQSTELFFEVIENSDRKKVPKKRLKAFLNQVGYKGGYVFKSKQNALDYVEAIKTTGRFDINSAINKKMQRKLSQSPQHQTLQQVREQATKKAVEHTQATLTAAMLLSLNSKYGFGPKRCNEIISEMNRLIQTVPQDELIMIAEKTMKITLRR